MSSPWTTEELHFAWQRVKFDLQRRSFITGPFDVELVELDLDGWLANLIPELSKSSPTVGSLYVTSAPKGAGLVRPAAWLPLEEHAVYNALVGRCLEPIRERVAWSQRSIAFSYSLTPAGSSVWVTRSRFYDHRRFRVASAAKAAACAYTVVIDVAAYYENISLPLLASDLSDCGAAREVVRKLSAILNAWAEPSGRGIPQGLTASDLLAKLFMDSVDRVLRAEGFNHTRFVDDIRIFCDDLLTAERTLVRATEILRRKGLQVQSTKTKILSQSDALTEIERAVPVIHSVRERYEAELRSFGLVPGDDYVPVYEIDDIVAKSPPPEIASFLEAEFDAHLASSFSPTVFRFLCNRLRAVGSRHRWRDIASMIATRPEETTFCLAHLRAVGAEVDAEDAVLDYLSRRPTRYEYQSYEILRWFWDANPPPSAPVLAEARRRVRETSSEWYVRSMARALLARSGDPADLLLFEEQLLSGPHAREEATLVCCLRDMESGRRNSLLGRVAFRNPMTDRAVRYAKR